MFKEPTITINGKTLTEGQAMTVRVAIGNFMIELLEENALGSDEHGKAMQKAYKERIREIQRIL